MGGSTIPRSFASQSNMVFTTAQHNKVQSDRTQHNMNSNPADVYTLRRSTQPYPFASQSTTPPNKLQHNTNLTQTRAFQAAAQSNSTTTQPSPSPPTTNQPTTKIEWLQNGTMQTLTLPIACSAREIESLQELAMNTQCGKTNVSPRCGANINNVARRVCAYSAELERSEKIKGGVFDGLSKREAEWLKELGFRE